MSNLVILPHQLFDKKELPSPKETTITLWEHPQYFTKWKYNKKRLMLHIASMSYYKDYLKKAKYTVKYIKHNEKFTPKGKYTIFDPIDKINLPNNANVEMYESPNFLLTEEDYTKYRKKTDKFFFNAFYMWGKKIIDVIPNIKSQDKDNRKKMPKGMKIPPLPKMTQQENGYLTEAKKRVEKEFSNNYGNCDNFHFPITHKSAKKWLDNFIKCKFDKFGPYQDYIDKNNEYLFHSVLAATINIGLLNPTDIIEVMEKYRKKNPIPMNSYEGYIRQLFWREYQRYCYIYFDFKNLNYFGNSKKLTKSWYDGTLGVPPVDDAIKTAFETGYLHHINRLMVVGNFMNLSELNPWEGFKWFMEFSCDSYEWVMHQNVLDMVFFISGGKTMRRPYISTSNYVLKMSNYSKGDWSNTWDEMYRKFVDKNEKKLYKFRYYIRLSNKKKK
jgi:deoxyribodipyrimidine photolyase-related protein